MLIWFKTYRGGSRSVLLMLIFFLDHIEFLGIFELESAECKWRNNIFGCKCDDVIEIGNYDGAQYRFVMETCGIRKPKETALIGTSVSIIFKSDNDYHSNYKGFSLKITLLSQSEGIIQQIIQKYFHRYCHNIHLCNHIQNHNRITLLR